MEDNIPLTYPWCTNNSTHKVELDSAPVSLLSVRCQVDILTHWGMNKMTAILPKTFWHAFSWVKTIVFWLKFHWCLFQEIQVIILIAWRISKYNVDRGCSAYRPVCKPQIDGLVQYCSISIANSLKIQQFCTMPSKYLDIKVFTGLGLCWISISWIPQ